MLLPDEYFKVYGEKLAECGEKKQAWYDTEKQFNRTYGPADRDIVFQRFANYESFTAAYRHYNNTGSFPEFIKIKITVISIGGDEETETEIA